MESSLTLLGDGEGIPDRITKDTETQAHWMPSSHPKAPSSLLIIPGRHCNIQKAKPEIPSRDLEREGKAHLDCRPAPPLCPSIIQHHPGSQNSVKALYATIYCALTLPSLVLRWVLICSFYNWENWGLERTSLLQNLGLIPNTWLANTHLFFSITLKEPPWNLSNERDSQKSSASDTSGQRTPALARGVWEHWAAVHWGGSACTWK